MPFTLYYYDSDNYLHKEELGKTALENRIRDLPKGASSVSVKFPEGDIFSKEEAERHLKSVQVTSVWPDGTFPVDLPAG